LHLQYYSTMYVPDHALICVWIVVYDSRGSGITTWRHPGGIPGLEKCQSRILGLKNGSGIGIPSSRSCQSVFSLRLMIIVILLLLFLNSKLSFFFFTTVLQFQCYSNLWPLLEYIFYVPATSAPVERIFSRGGLFVCPHRARISDRLLCQMMLVKCSESLLCTSWRSLTSDDTFDGQFSDEN
jgi:hAT family C-terminal dimerisation region